MVPVIVRIDDNTKGPFRATDVILAAASNSILGLTIRNSNPNNPVNGGYGSITHDPATAGVNIYVGGSTLNLALVPVNGKLLRKGESDQYWGVTGNNIHLSEKYFNGDNTSIVAICLEVW